jgi:hypothetical protein
MDIDTPTVVSNPISVLVPFESDPVSNTEPTPPRLTATGRPYRQRKLPQKLRDLLPEPPVPVPLLPEPEEAPIRRVLLVVRDQLVTAANSFGIWRDYPRRPTTDPDASLSLGDLSNSYSHRLDLSSLDLSRLPEPPPTPSDSDRPFYWPFQNSSIWRVMSWLNNGKTAKSEAEVTDFVQKVVLSLDFDKNDLVGFSAHRENQRLDKALSADNLRSQFSETSVNILVPSGDVSIPAQLFTVPGLLHQKLTSVICNAFNDPLAHLLHYSPFKLFHQNPVTKEEERVYSELYTSDAFHEAHEDLQRHGKLPLDDPDCKREKIIAALMIFSDATHLANFGTAKAWPIYLMLGNLSKYLRSQPNSGAIYHLAYIPSVSLCTML